MGFHFFSFLGFEWQFLCAVFFHFIIPLSCRAEVCPERNWKMTEKESANDTQTNTRTHTHIEIMQCPRSHIFSKKLVSILSFLWSLSLAFMLREHNVGFCYVILDVQTNWRKKLKENYIWIHLITNKQSQKQYIFLKMKRPLYSNENQPTQKTKQCFFYGI